jgi:triphosphatase
MPPAIPVINHSNQVVLSAMSREIELRFSARPEDLARLKKAQPRGFALGPPATRRLSTTYYDTPDFDFAKAGLSLRVRKTGRQFVQTVKDASTGALASERDEHESKLSSAEPDLQYVPDSETRLQLQTIANGSPVEAIVETEIRRTTRALKTHTGEHIELALDTGEIRTLANGRAVIPVNEVELELKQGSPIALYQAARKLCHAARLTISTESKVERGLRALEGRDIGAQKAGRMELAPECAAEEAFRATLNHCLRHLARNTGAIAEARDPEGIHQMRVGLRRLRAALSAFGDAFRSPALDELRGRAKILADVFGETRELDVFALELLAPIEDLTNKPGLPQLRLALDEIRRECWDGAADLIRSDEFTGFVLDLAVAIEARVWREGATSEKFEEFLRPARSLGAESLETALKKAIRRAKRLAELDTDQRHRLRIELKRLRYTAEFFAPLFPAKAVTPFLDRLSKLQDLFGTLNDAATAEHILRRINEHADTRGGPERSEAAAFVDGWHQSKVGPTWKKAKKRWKRFIKTQPFWRD